MITSKIKNVTKQKAMGAHFTPPELADVIAGRLLSNIGKLTNENLSVLDPSCGDGELLLAFARKATEYGISNYSLFGVEEDIESISSAKKRLNDLGVSSKITNADFLNTVTLDNEFSLFNNVDDLLYQKKVDVIIANPPYVRTQVLGADRAQELAKRFGLSGRVDLYHAFLVAMTAKLNPGGFIGVITSNRYLTTKGGTALREFISTNYEIIEILDLGDTKLFGAAVLPAILIAKKRDLDSNAVKTSNTSELNNFVRIYESLDDGVMNENEIDVSSVYEILEEPKSAIYVVGNKKFNVTVGRVTVTQNPKEPWVLGTNNEISWMSEVDKNSKFRIEDVAEVKVGIKTTADQVFIRSDWETLEEEIRPEHQFLRPLFSTEHAARWSALEQIPKQKVLYTHEIRDGKRHAIDFTNYKGAKAYLESHRERLEGRNYVIKAKRKWYEIWVPQNPELWKKPKVVFPDISPEPKFFYDPNGCIVDGNCYWITPKKDFGDDILWLIMAISNTRVMTKYHDIAFQNKLYAGRRRYLTQYVSKYPIPDPTTEFSQELIKLAKEIFDRKYDEKVITTIEEQIEHITAKAFGIDIVI